MVGRAAPISIAELRAVVAQVRALDRTAPTRASRPRGPALAAFLVILAISLRAATIPAFLPSSTDLEENRMRSLAKLGVVSSIVAITSGAAAQNAVQWRVQDGGNGHWYQGVNVGSQLSQTAAANAAVQRGGNLCSLATEAENQWVFTTIASNPSLWTQWSQWAIGPWIGARHLTPSVPEGWIWLDGTPWNFANWWSTEGCCSASVTASFWNPYPLNGGPLTPFNSWQDYLDVPMAASYIIEWSADCNNDGLVDYGQIRSGQLADANQNGVPDCCENGTPCNVCSGDVTRNGTVDGVDLALILSTWGTNGAQSAVNCDLNSDGTVDGIDLAIVLGGWGVCQ